MVSTSPASVVSSTAKMTRPERSARYRITAMATIVSPR